MIHGSFSQAVISFRSVIFFSILPKVHKQLDPDQKKMGWELFETCWGLNLSPIFFPWAKLITLQDVLRNKGG